MSSPNSSSQTNGLTNREYACILLKVPNSGTTWLDELINESVRRDLLIKYLPSQMWKQDLIVSWNVKRLMENLNEKDAN